MINFISSFSNEIFSFSKEVIVRSLSDQEKRILLIVSVAFGFLAACYVAFRCYNKFQGSAIKIIDEEVDLDEQVKKDSISSFKTAIELMFKDRGLEWGVWLDPLTPEQEAERYEQLKEAIEKILPEDINRGISYRDGMAVRDQTLLLQAIMCIEDPSKRLEIVKILLKKGADPLVNGFYHMDIEPMEEAKRINDPQLIDLLSNAIKDAKDAEVEIKGS